MSDLLKSTIEVLSPEGAAWRVAPGGDLDKTKDGQAANWETIREYLAALASVRDPQNTQFLEELETEFGIFSNSNLTDQQRRDALQPRVYERGSNGSKDVMRNALVSAGFDVDVYENDPGLFIEPGWQMVAGGANAIAGRDDAFARFNPGNPLKDPQDLISSSFQMFCGSPNAFAGREDAFAAFTGGEILVNGDVFESEKIFTSVAGRADAIAGTMTAGEFSGFERIPVRYDVPDDPDTWSMFFFVGAPGGWRSPDFEIAQAQIPLERRTDFRTLILKIKPVHSWAVLVVTYV